MDLQVALSTAIQQAIQAVYDTTVDDISLQPTKKEFEGTYTFVTFGLTKALRKPPVAIGQALGEWLQQHSPLVSGFNVVQGFLNISLSDAAYIQSLNGIAATPNFGTTPVHTEAVPGNRVLVEFSSPNTNKPLHLGHLRNNFLGDSVSRILAANGYDVTKACLVNDRGIHICKSMLAYQQFGQQPDGTFETPESSGLKGDKLIGKYYVLFDKELKKQLKPILEAIYEQGDLSLFDEAQQVQLQTQLSALRKAEHEQQEEAKEVELTGLPLQGTPSELVQQAITNAFHHGGKWRSISKALEDDRLIDEKVKKDIRQAFKGLILREEKIDGLKDDIKDIAQTKTTAMQEAQAMLRKWEQGDAETVALWSQMNAWVYAGFAETYKQIGVSFDKTYYESDTYLLGKDVVEEGLAKGVFYQKDDKSVWIDLTDEGLDQKLVLRGDGTSVYITQDLGTTDLKFNDFHSNRSIWVVGNEQDYHFKVLFAIMKRLGRPYADGCYHLSYGMVDLPSGKMKSREGTVVDADDLVAEVAQVAAAAADQAAKGKLDEFSEAEKQDLFHMIGLGALKYYLLKVDPQKRMLFNPEESVDVHGHTGPFIQYTHARIRSVLRKAEEAGLAISGAADEAAAPLHETEQDVIVLLGQYQLRVREAGTNYAPSYIAQYAYDLAKAYNRLFAEVSILSEPDPVKTHFRLLLSAKVAETIRHGMGLLGIDVPEKM
ncbi:arginyl-tRNA synthetase [Fibrella aestuarina BUZ 2]|uniref:Arginine--tRNA ligase n=1 Tax=Fibrella aestuarina BUZ 2 TaxID=1166018 RepID=I0KBS6_9BACT|nr:arginine--tRNA ligase [Fibrella aestuarina]CCH01579.1 arginyl-tRNA synthetase [Fibrella aestuarina BUZ 2]